MSNHLLSDFLAVALVVTASCTTGRSAQVDQENWVPDLAKSSISGPQQEFTPSLNTLDSVQVWITSPKQVPGAFQGGSTIINIRDGVNGPVLAASNPTYAPPGFSGT